MSIVIIIKYASFDVYGKVVCYMDVILLLLHCEVALGSVDCEKCFRLSIFRCIFLLSYPNLLLNSTLSYSITYYVVTVELFYDLIKS